MNIDWIFRRYDMIFMTRVTLISFWFRVKYTDGFWFKDICSILHCFALRSTAINAGKIALKSLSTETGEKNAVQSLVTVLSWYVTQMSTGPQIRLGPKIYKILIKYFLCFEWSDHFILFYFISCFYGKIKPSLTQVSIQLNLNLLFLLLLLI